MRQKGFGLLELAIVLGAAAALVAAIFGGVHMWNNHMDQVRSEAKKAGRDEALKEVADRDNEKLTAALAKVKALEDAARGEEARKQAAVDAAVAVNAKEKRNVEKQLETLRAGVRDGSLILRDPGAVETRTGCAGSGSGAGSAVAGNPAGSAGHDGGGQLSNQAAEFLLGEAARADTKVKALQLCRATLLSERGSSPP